jgi:hypothetical protein
MIYAVFIRRIDMFQKVPKKKEKSLDDYFKKVMAHKYLHVEGGYELEANWCRKSVKTYVKGRDYLHGEIHLINTVNNKGLWVSHSLHAYGYSEFEVIQGLKTKFGKITGDKVMVKYSEVDLWAKIKHTGIEVVKIPAYKEIVSFDMGKGAVYADVNGMTSDGSRVKITLSDKVELL